MRKALIKRLLGFACIISLMALNLNILAFAEPSPANDSFYYATKIESNTFISEKIETANDKDFYTFTLNSPSYVDFLLGLPAVVNYDVKLYRDSNLIYSCNGSSNSRSESFDLELGSGQYYIEIYGVNSSYSNSYYAFSLNTYSKSDLMEPNNDFSQPSNLQNVNGSLDATIESSTDNDFYKFNVAKTSRFEFNMSVPSGTNYDVMLYNATSSVIVSMQAGAGLPEKLVTTLAAGTYYIKIYGFNGSYSTKTYTMSMSLVALEVPQKTQPSYISLDNANPRPGVGEILEVDINIKNIAGFAGYQVHLTYDPAVLAPVNPLTMENKIEGNQYNVVSNGNILLNKSYSPTEMGYYTPSKGMLDFGKTYMNIEPYKRSNAAETTGTVGVICFKVLSNSPTSVKFENCASMTNPVNGTMIFNWDYAQLSSYSTYNLTLN